MCVIHRPSFSIHQLYKHSFACVFCVKVYAILSCVYLCNHNHNQDTKLCHCHSTLQLLLHQPLPCDNLESVLHLYNFVILNILCKWNHTIYDLWNFFLNFYFFGLFFLLRVFPLKSLYIFCMSQEFLFIAELHSLVWLFHRLLKHSPTEKHLGHFWFGAIMNGELLWTFLYKCVLNYKMFMKERKENLITHI